MTVLTDTARRYLVEHAIDINTVAELGVTEHQGRLRYPNGRQVALNGETPKALQPKGMPLEVWWPTGPPEDGATVLVCEGESDALAALSTIGLSEMQHAGGPEDPLAGITVAAVPGTGYPASRLAEELRGVGVVILAYDGDDAGRAATENATAALHMAGISCHTMEIPDGHDVADCLAQLDPALRPAWLAGRISDARLYTALEEEFGTVEGVGQASHVIESGPAGPPSPDRYHGRIIDVQAALAEPDEPLPWRCHGFAADGYLTTVAGRGGEGKSWLTLALACGVARGANVAGIDCVQGRALLFDAENGRRLIARRLRAAQVGPDLAVQPVDAGGLHVIRDIDWFRDVIRREGANLAVFDSLRVLSSGVNENDSDAMEPIITALKLLARETGAAIVLVHHRGRSEFSDFRGSSVILDQTDLLFTLGRVAGDPDWRHRRKVSTVKCRIDEEPAPRWVSISADRSRGLVTIDAAEEFEGGEQERPRDALRENVLDALGGIPRSARSIAKAVGRRPDDNTVKRVLADLEGEGLVERREDGWVREIGGVA
jgi:hypothetical protein